MIIPSLPTKKPVSEKARKLMKYIKNKSIKCIDFAEYSETVLSFHDQLSKAFSDSLSEWCKVKAGTK
jgi:hypothetical protein